MSPEQGSFPNVFGDADNGEVVSDLMPKTLFPSGSSSGFGEASEPWGSAFGFSGEFHGFSDSLKLSQRIEELNASHREAGEKVTKLKIGKRECENDVEKDMVEMKKINEDMKHQKLIVLECQRKIQQLEQEYLKRKKRMEQGKERVKGYNSRILDKTATMEKLKKKSVNLQQVWKNFNARVNSGMLRSFTPDDVQILLKEIDLEIFSGYFSECGIVEGELAHLDLVDQQYLQELRTRMRFSLGMRMRLAFHLKHITEKKCIFRPEEHGSFLGWNEQATQLWLQQVSCESLCEGFQILNMCGLALACVRKEELINEIMAVCKENHIAKRRTFREKISTEVWKQIETLRKENGIINSKEEKDVSQIGFGMVQFEEKKSEPLGDEIPEKFLCPIYQTLMEDPVCCNDGHTYERKAIEEWMKLGKKTSPCTRQELDPTSINPNLFLKSMIDDFKRKLNVKSRGGT
eukprot:CAMPEP_0167766712 /NCGR_PEP_ID=MMETSP0110_2-20121227/15522_1 /TAXON_ID=629695 /ORGANISM="Gymnochlora sp., Strain CCMP2014" /LENGTH=460 /DNA_ID=CAMNT_0007654821 /DNA_START=415 /DNA_END=1797 /DNA_ORIENTATION=-